MGGKKSTNPVIHPFPSHFWCAGVATQNFHTRGRRCENREVATEFWAKIWAAAMKDGKGVDSFFEKMRRLIKGQGRRLQKKMALILMIIYPRPMTS